MTQIAQIPFTCAPTWLHVKDGNPVGQLLFSRHYSKYHYADGRNRADNYGDDPYRWDNNNLWVNIIHWWDKKDCLQLLDAEGVQRNPVSIALNRSGGAIAVPCKARLIFSQHVSSIIYGGGQMHALRNEIVHKFGWDIWENPNKKILAEMKQQAEALPSFMPMCVGCKSRANQLDLFA